VSANDAKRNRNVGSHATFDTTMPKGQEYIIAYTMNISDKP